MKRKLALILALILVLSLASCVSLAPSQEPPKTDLNVLPAEETPAPAIDENGSYDGKDDVALYIHTYGRLPANFITKKEARSLGWEGGSVEKYAPGKCIGGDYFGNYEGALPDGDYRECDINTLGKSSRGAERIIYATDGRIYYTGDHYESFELLYGG
ncbi:MAG: ribonuclease [Oscillospiraceae bacterium]|nr:ribonuclease [Oscillospiraceae bacterium]